MTRTRKGQGRVDQNLRAPRLSRRALLRGTGTLAVALPWLEAMGPAPARAQSLAKRFIAVYQPGGTVLDSWRPSGSETEFTLGKLLQPLAGVQDKLIVVDGVDMKSARGEQHQAGIVALLTGTPQSGDHKRFASGPSLDQAIATRASMGKARNSLEFAVRWATGKSHGDLHPINSMTFADDDRFSPIPPRLDPVEIWESLFGNLDPSAGVSTEGVLARKKSILDYVDKRYASVSQRLGARDRAKLEEHLTHVRGLEQSLSMIVASGTCAAPQQVDTSGYDPASGKQSDDSGKRKDASSDAAIPLVGRYMMDMMVTAMACDITAVGTLQWSDTEAKHTFPWLNLSEHHHYYQHDGGFRREECETIATWYAEQHAYLIERMAGVQMGAGTLLDESVILVGSELQDPPSHDKDNAPFLVAGNGGGLQTGRYLQYNGESHNDLLLALLGLFGDERDSFGTEQYCSGPLARIV